MARPGIVTCMSNGAKIAIFRVTAVATAVLWVIQGWRLIQGESIGSGPVAFLWLVVFGLYLLAVPWSAEARAAAKAGRANQAVR